MAILDIGPIYTNTGSILQIEYGQKAADSGDTCLALKNSKGVVILVEKPIDSNLFITERDEKIKKVTSSIYLVASGMETDVVYTHTQLKDQCIAEKNEFESEISPEKYRTSLLNNVHQFTRYSGCRVLGINILSCIRYKNQYKILSTNCSGKSVFYKAAAIGKGTRIAKTELEKLDLEEMSVQELIEAGIRIMYKAFDPFKHKPFDLEIGVISEETNSQFKRLKKEEYSDYVELYKDYSVEDNE